MPHRFHVPLRPVEADIDELGHVNNAVYVRWLQDVGTAHWYALATPEERATRIWVVVRHEIDYLKPCLLGEALTGETWTENPRGARFDRIVRILGPDATLRATARTTWVLLDMTTKRPLRVPKDLATRFLENRVLV